MVSMNPPNSPPEGFYIDTNGVALPGLNPFPSSSTSKTTSSSSLTPDEPLLPLPTTENNTTNNSTNSNDININNDEMNDNSKKIRKPYTITKSRESWTEPEHDKFLEALQLFDRDWKKIEAFIGSKTVIQIRSHAQKYFLKVQKSGSNEHLPPPRPKRKATHPYPQKAPKNASSLSLAPSSFQPSTRLLDPGLQRRESATAAAPIIPSKSAVLSSQAATSSSIGAPNVPKGDIRSTGPSIANNGSSSTESTAVARTSGDMNGLANPYLPLRVLPDFAQVYGFIGSVFDPEATEHLQRLKKMDPIDVETVLLLMRNLSINLTSPDFEDHRRLLASYDIDSDKGHSGGSNHIVCGN